MALIMGTTLPRQASTGRRSTGRRCPERRAACLGQADFEQKHLVGLPAHVDVAAV